MHFYCLTISAMAAAANWAAEPPTVTVVGGWEVEVSPGTVRWGERAATVAAATRLTVRPAERVTVRDERYAELPVFNAQAAGWLKGARLAGLVTQETTAAGMLDPATVRLKPDRREVQPFVLGQDYQLDPVWATIGRLPGGAIQAGQAVFADYAYSLSRLDRLVVNAAGAVLLKPGQPHLATPHPPPLAAEEIPLANVYVPGRLERLSDENLFPIELAEATVAVPPGQPSVAELCLPRTLAKLRAGEPVTIVAWGDSVTAGGGVGGAQELWYQYRFLALLRERFPQAAITLHTAAWPGGNSRGYLDSPAGSQYDFQRDVLDRKPDLVTIEFVNDAYLDEDRTQTHYAEILERLKPAEPEVILITPHFVRPDWMGVNTLKVDADPRPYVAGLRRFAAEHHLALADASRRWAHLWREGLPYLTLLANCINHPDERGHEIFAQVLMELFPPAGQ